MNKRVLPYVLLFLAIPLSCTDETTIYEDILQDDVVLETNEAKLQGSIAYGNSGVLAIYEKANEALPSGKLAEPPAGDYPLTLVAQVKPPSYSGSNTLTASHVDVAGNYAYVAYNQTGDAYFGAIEIINIANPHSPRVTSRLFYLNADINAILYEGGYVYVAGGVNAETSVTATSNSFIAKIHVNGNRLDVNAGIQYGFQQGYNATDLLLDGDRILATSGKEGSLAVYNKEDLSLLQEVAYFDLRSLSMNQGKLAVLDAGKGVQVLDGNLAPVKDISINTDLGSATKKTIDFKDDAIMVAEGAKGTGVYSFSSGTLLEYIPILVHPDGVDGADVVTNAVAANEEALLMANGGAGLCLAKSGPGGHEVFGIIELEGSINYVASKGDYIFAASGKEGLQIVKFNRPSASLEGRCADLPDYNGSSKLIVQAGEVAAYSGAKRFNTLNVSGRLLLCGSWTVQNAAVINPLALFEMKGTFAVGRNNRRRNLTVDQGATLRVEGDVTIYGDLILKDGAKLEFIGTDAVVNIFGSVIQGQDVQITGEFDDLRNAF